VVRIARSGGVIAFPCRFSLVGAMNPCPCGYLGDARRACRCTRHQLELHRARLSGPLSDRIDIHVTELSLPEARVTGETPARAARLSSSGNRALTSPISASRVAALTPWPA
jgi:magnesium chelatase family protein